MAGLASLNISDNRMRMDGLAGPVGIRTLAALLRLASESLEKAKAATRGERFAAVTRLRGTGRGIHFSNLVAALEAEHPLTLVSPFEDSDLVAGGVWDGNVLIGGNCKAALAKLRWSAGADDLPMHVHDFSDRFIIVHEGRGFFHVSDQGFDEFDGSDVRSIPAHERDVFIFTRGVVHTFSTLDQPMTLLSCRLRYVAFDDPDQFRIPAHRWIARDNPERAVPCVACDPAWTVLAHGKNRSVRETTIHPLAGVPPLA